MIDLEKLIWTKVRKDMDTYSDYLVDLTNNAEMYESLNTQVKSFNEIFGYDLDFVKGVAGIKIIFPNGNFIEYKKED